MKYGIIYLWFDRKHKRYYLGRHWGTEVDGYVCSSKWMKSSYNRRKDDFKRRIISRIHTSQEDLVKEEQRWLNMIKPKECGVRYYNKTLRADMPSTRGMKHKPETIEKMRAAHRGKISPLRGIPRSQEWKERFSKNHPRPQLGKVHLEETKLKMSVAHKGKPKTPEHAANIAKAKMGFVFSDEAKQKISESHKGMKKPWVKGRTYLKDPEATREKMRQASLLREHRKRKERLLNTQSDTKLKEENGRLKYVKQHADNRL